jgi:hypothetical protein
VTRITSFSTFAWLSFQWLSAADGGSVIDVARSSSEPPGFADLRRVGGRGSLSALGRLVIKDGPY